MYDKGPLRSQIFQHPGKHLCQPGIIDADQLACRTGWVRQRPQHIEDRADTDLPPRTDGVFHRPMQPGSEEKSDPDLLHTFLDDLRCRTDVDPQGLQDIRAAAATGDGAIAVFRHGQAGAATTNAA